MSSKAYVIKTATLRDIADAIRSAKNISGNISVSQFAKAYKGESFDTATTDATAEDYIIDIQTLIDVADAIRENDGTTQKIPVSDLAARILGSDVAKKLNAPHIFLDNGVVPEYDTTAILGKAVLGYAVLGNAETLPKLATPVISLRESGGSEEPDTPKTLSAPVIRLEEFAEGDDEPEQPKVLSSPVIYIEEIQDSEGEPEEPEPVALDAPVIYLHVEEEQECLHASYTSSVTTEPTCAVDGKRTLVCSECGYTWTEPIPAIGHNYSSVIVTPTCTVGGYTLHTCANCGDTYTDSQTAALGHDWGENYYSDTFATGYGHVCNRCGEKESLEPPMAKLDAPVIYLEETAKLDAPVISIEEVIEELTAPTNFQYDYETSMFSWDSVKGATKYRLWFVGLGTAPVVETQFDVEPGFLPYVAKIYGYSDGDKISASIEAEDDDGNVSERTVIYIDVEEARKYLPKLDAPSITLE